MMAISTIGITTLPAGTDNQAYCYDEQNRLTWAGNTGIPGCGGTAIQYTSLPSYQQTYAFDTMNRLTTGPLGAGYGYGDANHLNALTTAPSYAASYDTAGDMTSRNGQPLTYDAMRRMLTWQNTTSSPTSIANYAYDGEGERVQQTVTTNGTTTTTQYIGTFEEISTTGGTTTTIKYYNAGLTQVTNVNGTLSYLVSDGLGSVSAALNGSGNLISAQLFAPFGTTRYSSGTMPTSFGYTGQRGDPSGLTYMHARYYDGSVGAFISADTVQGPNRYGYVAGNPTTMTDPTGQMAACGGQAMEDGQCHRYHHGTNSGCSTCGKTPPTVTTKNPTPTPVQAPLITTSGGDGHFCDSCEATSQILCLNGLGCVDTTVLAEVGSHINIEALTKAIADTLIWTGAVAAFVITIAAALSQASDPFTAWLFPRAMGLGVIGVGALIAGLSALLPEYADGLGIPSDALAEVQNGIYQAGVMVMGAGALIAITGSIGVIVAQGWTLINTLMLIASGMTALGSFLWEFANQDRKPA